MAPSLAGAVGPCPKARERHGSILIGGGTGGGKREPLYALIRLPDLFFRPCGCPRVGVRHPSPGDLLLRFDLARQPNGSDEIGRRHGGQSCHRGALGCRHAPHTG